MAAYLPTSGDRTDTLLKYLSQITFAIQNSVVSQVTVVASSTITTSAVKIIAANPNRKGLILYNNSANSVYLKYGAAGNGGTDMTAILATFNQFVMPLPIFTGEIWGIRNAGTGQVVATELF